MPDAGAIDAGPQGADAADRRPGVDDHPGLRDVTGGPTGRLSPRAVFLVGAILLALLAGYGLGRLDAGPARSSTAPVAVGDTATGGHPHTPGTGPHDHPAVGQGPVGTAGGGVAGLAVGDATFRLAVESTAFPAGETGLLRFRILDGQRQPVTSFTVVHDKPLHLIVVSRDLSRFQHLHPVMARDGTWSIPLTLPEPGSWRMYADFTATGPAGAATAAVLAVDLTVAGDYRPRGLPDPAPRATVAGYEVRYAGRPSVGAAQPLLFTITKAGAPVTVRRYLGAYGHLVVLREGDLGYVHVHPESGLVAGAVKFWLAAPSPGRYRMFLDFQVAGAVHTAEFTLAVD